MLSPLIAGAGRRRWRRSPAARTLCLLAAVSAAWCITGCRRSPDTAPDADTLRIGFLKGGEGITYITEALYTDTLLVMDWQGRPAVALADKWTWEDEDRTLRLQLHPGVRFHDGTAVTGEIVASILRARIAELRDKGRGAAFDAVEHIEALDEGSLVFRLSRPDAFLIGGIADVPVVDPAKDRIGTGPFKLLKTSTLEAIRNDEYYRGRPGIARVKVQFYETLRGASVALMKSEVDLVPEISRESIEFLRGTSRVELYPSIRPYYIPLVFNLRHPILGRVEVRRAIAEAIDREEIVRQAMRGHGQPADDPVWPAHWAYNPAGRRYAYNPAAARLRLDAAGLPITEPPPGSHRMASRFQIPCLFVNPDSQFERIGLLLQRQLADVGIDLVLEGTTQASLIDRVQAGDFTTYFYQLAGGRSFHYTYGFWHSPATKSAALQNTGYTAADDVLDRLRNAGSEAEIRTAVGDLRERFYEDVPAAFLAWMQYTRGVDARFDVGDRLNPEILANLWRWRVSPAVRAAR
ncbi:MAG: ABC transporter substrate-binding protein [Acidobacteriota bacterium]